MLLPVGSDCISVSAYRVLRCLQLLISQPAITLSSLKDALAKDPRFAKHVSNDTLGKYLHTLTEMGLPIQRTLGLRSGQIALQAHPFPLEALPEEIQAVTDVLRVLSKCPAVDLHRRYWGFLGRLSWLLPTHAERLRHPNLQPMPLASPLQDRLLVFEQYCRDRLWLSLTIATAQADPETPMTSDTEVIWVEPLRVYFDGARPMLHALEKATRQPLALPLDDILSARQSVAKGTGQPTQMQVAFELMGRLAKSYRLYPGEVLLPEASQPGRLCIECTTEDPFGLMRRLLRYGDQCVVLRPSQFRHQFLLSIQRMLGGQVVGHAG
jgi:predicted DNA-binding transcriptional regulator YafY